MAKMCATFGDNIGDKLAAKWKENGS